MAFDFKNEYAVVKKDGMYGYIDTQGGVIVPGIVYEDLDDIFINSEDNASGVGIKNGRYYIINIKRTQKR